jgi:hypothetical protein
MKNKILFMLLVGFILFIGLSSISANTWCYQGVANVTTACGGLNTGFYLIGSHWITPNAPIDGDWGTGSYTDNGGAIAMTNATYYKPIGAINDSLVQAKAGSLAQAPANSTIPAGCWNFNANYIVFSLWANGPNGRGQVYCWNGATMNLVYENTADNMFVEMGMEWNMSSGGAGINNVTLISPANNTNIFQGNYYFSANYTFASGANFTNATLYLTNSSGIINTNFTNSINPSLNISNLSLSNISIQNNMQWKYVMKFKNQTGYFNITSFTYFISRVPYLINSVTYNSSTYETADENYYINITLADPSIVSAANFWYNGIDVGTSTKTQYGSDVVFSNSYSIPVNTTQNSTFFWNLIYSSNSYNLTAYNQTVNYLSLGKCGGNLTTMIFNFSAFSEADLSQLMPYNFYGTFYYGLGQNISKNVSMQDIGINEEDICTSSNSTYSTNAVIQYEKASNVKRSYYLINAPVTNITKNVSLYLLNTSLSTSFIISVLDYNQIPISSAYTIIKRFYPGTNQFNIVEMGLTDNTGGTVGHFESETEDYQVSIERTDGTVIYIGPTQKVYCTASPCTLQIQTSGNNVSQFHNFGNVSNFFYTTAWDNSTRTWTMNYADTSGTLGYGRFWVYYVNPRLGPQTICNISSSNLSGSLVCNTAGYNGTIYGAVYVSHSPEQLVYLDTLITLTALAIFGMEGLFLSLMVLLTLGFAGLWNPVVGIILVIAGMLVLSLTGIASFGAVTLWGIIIIGLLIIWELNN